MRQRLADIASDPRHLSGRGAARLLLVTGTVEIGRIQWPERDGSFDLNRTDGSLVRISIAAIATAEIVPAMLPRPRLVGGVTAGRRIR